MFLGNLVDNFLLRILPKKTAERIVDGILIREVPLKADIDIKPEIETEPEPIFRPLALPDYQPSYLLDDDNGDLGLYYAWLSNRKITKKTINLYFHILGVYKSQAREFSVSVLRDVLSTQKRTMARRLIVALRSYARYRAEYGDPRFWLILMCTDEFLLHEHDPAEIHVKVLSPKQIDLLNAKAHHLCSDGDRAGIWLAFMIRGVPCSAIRHIVVDPETCLVTYQMYRKERSQHVAIWIVRAVETISDKLWRVDYKVIKRRISEYEEPSVLLHNRELSVATLGR
jgi:hypothetical protein